MTGTEWNFTGLRALFINCTLKRSPEVSNTQALVDASRALMERHGVATESLRLIDHDVATGVWPDMTEHGWASDEWPQIQERVFAADILVLAGPDLARRQQLGHEALHRAPLRDVVAAQPGRPVRLLRARRPAASSPATRTASSTAR